MEKSDKDTSGNPEKTAPAPAGEIKPTEYIRAARGHLNRGQQKAAYTVMIEANVRYPDDPLILSFYGSLQALVDNKYRSGIETCRKALARFKPKDPHTASVLYPLFYLNLGRAYLAADRKKEAIAAFQKGLSYDMGNIELKKEMKQLGIRKNPPVSFLDRSNPVNILMGKLLNKKR